jgi:hypothetical protein
VTTDRSLSELRLRAPRERTRHESCRSNGLRWFRKSSRHFLWGGSRPHHSIFYVDEKLYLQTLNSTKGVQADNEHRSGGDIVQTTNGRANDERSRANINNESRTAISDNENSPRIGARWSSRDARCARTTDGGKSFVASASNGRAWNREPKARSLG